jgi:hypothetical protein
MATLVLQVAGQVIGTALGGPIGGLIGQTVGAIAGSLVDTSLLASGGGGVRRVEGPRLSQMPGLASSEGAAIPRLYGRGRLGGQLIWATRFEEEVNVAIRKAPKQGGKASQPRQKTVETTYAYYANIAVGLCEGPIAFVRRVWVEGRELDLSTVTMRVHTGEETQPADPLIAAREGADAPAYRGLAYVVFERLALADYGNRVPQFSFEVVRAVPGAGAMVRAVTLIPGASEFIYAPTPVTHEPEPGVSEALNRHQLSGLSDVDAAITHLIRLCPNVRRVSLVVAWFGDDLRAGSCTVAPRVEIAVKPTTGQVWQAAGLDRAAARIVTEVAGKPAYGGTPSDASVIALIRRLKEFGLEVVLYPFVMMDVPAGNALPDPASGSGSQPPYPWRGRITCMPGPGRSGTVDGTAAAASQIAAFVGTVTPGDMALSGEAIICAKPDEWSYRRHILHYAQLSVAAGGVDGFIVGSELIGLTRVRSASGVYPMVAALAGIAADVRAIVGGSTKLTYAADWTEYGGHALAGGEELRFPLDPLWAHPAIDAIGIDFYAPLSDWRDGAGHADAELARDATDVAYLRGNLRAGEGFDWYYADAAGRAAQTRLPITDGLGKPWVFRQKDIAGWWSNPHVERVGGVELASPTAFQPGAKPVWLTEIGIPAVDKGGNGPNVFPDPKSSENAAPPFSTGARDDLVQMRGLEAILTGLDPAQPGFVASNNPVHAVTGRRMIDAANIFVWTWDARPFPAFPDHQDAWADGANWEAGHWITGRIEGVTLDRLVQAVVADYGLPAASETPIDGFVDGYVIDRPMSARAALEPLGLTFGFDTLMSGGRLSFRGRGGAQVLAIGEDDLVPDRDGRPFTLTRQQESELPRELRLGFIDGEEEYRAGAAIARRLIGSSQRENGHDTAIVTRRAEAQRLAEERLQEAWSQRESLDLDLSPGLIGLEPGDVVGLDLAGTQRLFRLTRIVDGPSRRATARIVEPEIYRAAARFQPRPSKPSPAVAGRPFVLPLDLPIASGTPVVLQRLAAYAAPWPGALGVWRSGDGASFEPLGLIEVPSVIGETLSTLAPGPVWRWDRANALDIRLSADVLVAVTPQAALGGANLLALRDADGAIEIVAAANVELTGPRSYRLSRLMRGLGGSEPMASRLLASGARVIVLDNALFGLTTDLADLNRPWTYRIGPAAVDVGDPAMTTLETAATPLSLRPLAPVRLRARRVAGGVHLTWVRQTRIGGDAWEPLEVPLGEDREAYELTIMEGATVKRRVDTLAPTFFYDSVLEIADFGAPQTLLDVSVAQVSTSVGPGQARRATLAIG